MTITDSAATLIPGPVLPKDGDRFAAWLADINWAKLFPEGRDLYYEGENPEEFAGAIREEFGFDPSADPLWGKRTEGGDGQAGSTSYGFHAPAEKLDGIYDRHGSRRFPGRLGEPVSYTALTPLSFLERSARVWPDKIAVIYGSRRFTYSEFAAEAQRAARALRASGIQPGDRVAYLMPNLPEMLIAHFAVPLAGAVLVAINTRLTAEEISYIMRHSGAKILVTDAALLPRAAAAANGADALTQLIVAIDAEAESAPPDLAADSRLVNYSEFLAKPLGDPLPWSVPDELARIAINYTSGTTGLPKGVIYTHRGAYLNSFAQIVHSRLDEDSVYLWTLPMFHCNGWCDTWAVTAIGGTHVCLREARGETIWKQMREHGVTHLNAAPTLVSSILNTCPAGPLPWQVVVTTAGSSPSPTMIAEMERMGFKVVHVYGLTETYGPITICQPQPQWADLPADQRAVLQARQGVGMIPAGGLRVVDKQMTDVPADGSTMGEIVVRGNTVMAGYYRDQEATAEAFSGGWFHSGDLGVMYPDGSIELRDRAKDIIISGGENISSVEIEQALMSHPAVREAAVVAVPDDKWGERPKAYVVLRPGRSATPEDLIAHVRTKIAGYKTPRDIDITVVLPKTSTGKIQKYMLRKTVRAGHATA